MVKEWLRRHPEFRLEPVPPYSPNVNLIERLWKFMKRRALEPLAPDVPKPCSELCVDVLDHLEDYHDELATLMVDTFHIIEKKDIPVQYQEAT